jgi:hypothetical protein
MTEISNTAEQHPPSPQNIAPEIPPLPPPDPRHLAEGRALNTLFIALVAGLLLVMLWHAPKVWGANDASRWATVYSLVEQGTWQIDHTPWSRTIDRVRIGEHFYSSKPPVLSTLVAGEYFLLKRFSHNFCNLHDQPALTIKILLLFTNFLPFLIFLYLYSRLVTRLTPDPWTRLYAMAAAAMGTMMTGFLVSLNNHTVAACALLFALYPAYFIFYEQRRSGWRFALVGFFAALTAVTEFPAVVVLAALGAALLWICPRKTLIYFLPASLIPLGLHFYTNYLITGGLSPAYAHVQWYLYPGSVWHLNPATGALLGGGIDAQWEPWKVYFFHSLFGHHGWFSLMPIFLITLVGLLRLFFVGYPYPRAYGIAALVLLIYLLVIYTFFTGHRNYGGNSTGPRYFLWIIPLWLLILPAGLEWLAPWRWWRGLCLILLVFSAGEMMWTMLHPWHHPWMLLLLRYFHVINY